MPGTIALNGLAVAIARVPRAILMSAANARIAVNTLAPVKIFVYTLAIFACGLILAPFVPEAAAGFGATLCWWSVGAGGVLGAMTAGRSRVPIHEGWFQVRAFPARMVARQCIRIGLVGVLLSLFDRFIIRGAPLSFDIIEEREIITEAGSGAVGVIAAAMSSFATLGLVSCWLARALGQPLRWGEQALAVFSLLVYLFLSVSLGSRSVLLVCILMHLLAAIFFQRLRRGRIEWRTILTVVGALLFLVFASVWLFLQRLEQMGLSPVDSIQLSAYAFTLQPSQGLLDALQGSGDFGYVGAAFYSLVLYVFHGFYEFCLLFDNYASPHLLGQQALWLPLKLLDLVLGRTLEIDIDSLIGFRTGVYTTFAGPMFLDFGWLAPAYSFLLFLGLAYPFRRITAGDWRWLPAALTVAVIIIVAPATSLLDSSSGMFPLIAGFVLPWLGRKRGWQETAA
jgi:hypothetical protein